MRSRTEDIALVVAFVVVHGVLVWLALAMPNQPIGDVTITYRRWIETAHATGVWVGLDTDWVYPIAALVPMMLAALGGTPSIAGGWLFLMTVLDAVAAVFLWRYRVPVGARPARAADVRGAGASRVGDARGAGAPRVGDARGAGVARPVADRCAGVHRPRVLWWWLAFLLALGPIGLGRIDTVATAVALVGIAFLASRPAIASGLFTLAAWVKVWPAALVAVLLVRRHHRGAVVLGAVTVTAFVVLVDVLFGGAAHLLSFIGQQAGRALQIESPLATPFMWQAMARGPGAAVYYDDQILTFEVSGPGTHLAAQLSTPLMALVVLVGLALAARAVLDGVRRSEIAPLVAMVLVGALLVANKVGSPQYIGWYAVPVVWGLVAGRESARRFLPAAAVTIVVALLTQAIYPGWYDRVLALDPVLVTVLTVRNLLEVALLVWSVVALTRAGAAARRFRAAGLEARVDPAA